MISLNDIMINSKHVAKIFEVDPNKKKVVILFYISKYSNLIEDPTYKSLILSFLFRLGFGWAQQKGGFSGVNLFAAAANQSASSG